MSKFTHLHLHTHYSLLDGLTKPLALVKRVKELGMNSVAVTDHGNMYGAIEFYKTAQKEGIKPIIGCEVYMAENKKEDRNPKDEIFHLVLLVKNKTGYKNLVKLVSEAHINGFYYKPRIDRELLEKYSEGLVCLSGCLAGELSQAMLKMDLEKADEIIKWHRRVFSEDYYIEIQRHENNKEQHIVEPLLLAAAKKHGIKTVAACDSHYLVKEDAHTHDVLLAIQTGKDMEDENRMSLMEDEYHVMSPEEIERIFSDLPEAIENTQEIADKCNLELKFGEIKLPTFVIPEKIHAPNRPFDFVTKDMDYDDYLRILCTLGAEERYGIKEMDEWPIEILDRLNYELEVIKKTGFASYLLIVQDIVNWARNNGVMVGPGRGSAAGSLICYLIGITNIDPIKYGLLFERFMNPERISMPDIDMDFDDERRDDVLKYVAEKYGNKNVAQIITFGTLAARGAIRDVGRVLGVPLIKCDKIAKLVPQTMPLEEGLRTINELKHEYDHDDETKKVIDIAIKLDGVIKNASTHACGVVISKEKLENSVPLQLSTKDDGSVITQYDMNMVADMGLLKMDFLGLKNMTIIKKTSEAIKGRYGFDFNINSIPLDDGRTFKLLQEARTTSIFQLESDGMKRYLRALRPTSIDDIAVMVSLYRPGPMELIPEYVDRKHKRKQVEYLHKSIEPILKDTYGIMIYQEQLMACARELAGLTLAEADILRKAVGKKDANLLHQQEKKFKDGAKKNNIPVYVYEKFWELIEPFSRYGFNKSHAVSYAMIAYQTAFLKANYPLEFMEAVMNCDGGDIERIAFLIAEADSMGIKISPPDINSSMNGFSIDGNKIRFGLAAIKGLGLHVTNIVIEDRFKNGKFKNVADFVRRMDNKQINKKAVELFARSGVFGEMVNRNILLKTESQITEAIKFKHKEYLPEFKLPYIGDVDMVQKLIWEKELLGLFVSDNPLEKFRNELSKENPVDISDISRYLGGFIKVAGIITSTRKILTKTGKQMMFAQIQDNTGTVDVVVFPSTYERFSSLIKNNSIVAINGKIEDNSGESKIIMTSIKHIAELM